MAKKPTRRPPVRRPAPKKKAPPRAPPRKPEPAPELEGRAFPVEIDPKRIEEGLRKIREELVHWANKGRYTRVRFKFRGKQLLPDLPLAAVMAAEGLTFYWGGILRALIFNFAGKAVFDVELVNDADGRVQQGKEALLSGNLDQALEHFRAALAMNRDSANAQLNIGVALRLQGDLAGARAALERAKELDPAGPFGAEAEKVLAQIRPADPSAPSAIAPMR